MNMNRRGWFGWCAAALSWIYTPWSKAKAALPAPVEAELGLIPGTFLVRAMVTKVGNPDSKLLCENQTVCSGKRSELSFDTAHGMSLVPGQIVILKRDKRLEEFVAVEGTPEADTAIFQSHTDWLIEEKKMTDYLARVRGARSPGNTITRRPMK